MRILKKIYLAATIAVTIIWTNMLLQIEKSAMPFNEANNIEKYLYHQAKSSRSTIDH